jgi:hypothetical protein
MTALIDAPVLVHAGLPKTATTWLQEHLFSHPELGFWPPALNETSRKQRTKSFGRLFYFDDGERLIGENDFDVQALRAKLAAADVPDGLVPVISNERLAGHPLSNAFDRAMIARRIDAVLPKARVLVVIREQRSMILSSYVQYLKYGGWRSLDGYIAPPSDGRMPVLQLDVWNYERLATLYHGIFGAERVLILPYEMFIREPQAYVARICRFAGAPVPTALPFNVTENRRRSLVASYYLRWLTCINRSTSANGHFPHLLGKTAGKAIDRGIKIAVASLTPRSWDTRLENDLKQRIENAVGPRYEESNRRLASLIGFDLGAYGYRV